LLWRDVLVVLALLSLGAGCVDRASREGRALLQAGGLGNAVDRAGFLVFLPSRASNVATWDDELAGLHAQ
jgi:lipoprotein signal peptidase